MSQLPPPLPPQYLKPENSTGSTPKTVPPLPPSLPKRAVSSKLDRRLGDLTEEEVAMLLPPDEEDEEWEEANPSPSLPGGRVPLPPSGMKNLAAFQPPPILSEEPLAEEEPLSTVKKQEGWTPKQKTLLTVLGLSLIAGTVIIGLAVVFSPERIHHRSAAEPIVVESTPIEEKPQEPEKTSQPKPARKGFDLNQAVGIEFADPGNDDY